MTDQASKFDLAELVSIDKVNAALDATKAYLGRTRASSEKVKLFGDACDSVVHLSLVLKKVPVSVGRSDFEMVIPHSFRLPETTSVCLFCKDVDKDKWGPDVDKSSRFYKEYLRSEKGISGEIAEVIALRQLKREYKTFEAKRKLCSAFDVFLVDDRIVPHIHRNLGKSFHQAKKLPFPVPVERGDLSSRIRRVLSSTRLTVKQSSVRCCCPVGLLQQPTAQLSANLAAILQQLDSKLPGGLANLRSAYLNCDRSPMIPFYLAVDSSNLVTLPPPKKRRPNPIAGELSTLDNEGGVADVRVYADGRVRLLDKQGREFEDKAVGGKRRAARRKAAGLAKKRRARSGERRKKQS